MNDLEQFGLNDRQRLFVEAIVSGCPVDVATLKAGYENELSGYQILRSPHVLAAVHHGVQRLLQAEAPVSLNVLRKIRDDDKAPARVRADVGIKMMQLAGHVVPSTSTSAADKPLAEMTRDEMVAYIDRNQAAIDRAESELAARAKDVSVPDSVPKSTEAAANTLTFLD